MKKATERTEALEMKAQYDFRGGERGKLAGRYAAGTNLVLLAPDVAEVYRDSDSVNNALRILMNASRRSTPLAAAGGKAGQRPVAATSEHKPPRRKRIASVS